MPSPNIDALAAPTSHLQGGAARAVALVGCGVAPTSPSIYKEDEPVAWHYMEAVSAPTPPSIYQNEEPVASHWMEAASARP